MKEADRLHFLSSKVSRHPLVGSCVGASCGAYAVNGFVSRGALRAATERGVGGRRWDEVVWLSPSVRAAQLWLSAAFVWSFFEWGPRVARQDGNVLPEETSPEGASRGIMLVFKERIPRVPG